MNAIARALSKPVHRTAVAIAIPFLAAVTLAAPASATTIERVVSASGVEAWLVHEPAVPLIAIDFAFSGGAAQDPAGKAGTAYLAASTLNDGVGEFDSKTFHERLERKAIELNFSADRDALRGSLRTLSENRDEAFEDLRLSLTAPASMPTTSSSIARKFSRHCAAPRRARAISPTSAGGTSLLPAIPIAARRTARWNRCRISPSPT